MAHENATPRPWKVLNDWSSHTDRPYQIVSKATGHPVTRWGNTFITAALPTCVDNAALIVEAVNAYGTLRAENERLAAFARWVVEECVFTGSDLSGFIAQDKASELGLIVPTTYDPAKHGPHDAAEAGDEWFVFGAALSEAQP